jgi:hypothetical protein
MLVKNMQRALGHHVAWKRKESHNFRNESIPSFKLCWSRQYRSVSTCSLDPHCSPVESVQAGLTLALSRELAGDVAPLPTNGAG